MQTHRHTGAAHTPADKRPHQRFFTLRTGRKRICLYPFVALFLMACTVRVLAATTATLNIYNWADYIDPELLEEFERE